jgi:hypothetical protein
MNFHAYPNQEGHGKIYDSFGKDVDMGSNFQVATNFNLLVNLEILLSPYYMLELMHN